MDPTIDALEAEEEPRRSYRRLWCAVLSVALPGLGDWLVGNRRRSALFFAIFGATLICFWPLRLPGKFAGLSSLAIAMPALSITSSCLTFFSRRDARDAAANWWVLVIIPLALLCAESEMRLALVASGFRVYGISSSSMEPTLFIGDGIVVDQRYFRDRRPEPGEVVVFRHRDLLLVKRLIAVGGDTIGSKDGQITLNGQTLQEAYAIHRNPQFASEEMNSFGPIRIPEGQVFLVGDDRDESLDSRSRTGEYDYGPVFANDVVGKALYVYSSKVRNRVGQAIR
jgi:signal peptidase I